MNKKDYKNLKELYKAIMLLKDKKEYQKFFRDLLTEKELIEFGKRWQAARMLNEKVSYVKIEKETKLSPTTVARISKWLNQGMGGYRLIINRLSKHHTDSFHSRKRPVLCKSSK